MIKLLRSKAEIGSPLRLTAKQVKKLVYEIDEILSPSETKQPELDFFTEGEDEPKEQND